MKIRETKHSEGQVVLERQIAAGSLVIRYPNSSDGEVMTNYINNLSKEKTFISFQGEEMTLKAEQDFLDDELKKIADKQNVLLLAFIDGNLVGISGVQRKTRVANHEGVLGISIAKEHRKQGIGKILFTTIMQVATQLPNLRIVTLEVFANNPVAIQMYKAFGFIEYGRLPQGIQYRGEYVDAVHMFKAVMS